MVFYTMDTLFRRDLAFIDASFSVCLYLNHKGFITYKKRNTYWWEGLSEER